MGQALWPVLGSERQPAGLAWTWKLLLQEKDPELCSTLPGKCCPKVRGQSCFCQLLSLGWWGLQFPAGPSPQVSRAILGTALESSPPQLEKEATHSDNSRLGAEGTPLWTSSLPLHLPPPICPPSVRRLCPGFQRKHWRPFHRKLGLSLAPLGL